MDNYDPIETVHQLRAWVEESIPSSNAGSLAEAKARNREITRVMDQLNKLDIPISEEIILEKRALEKLIGISDETKKLLSLAKELSSLARDIRDGLRGQKEHGGSPGKAPAKKLRVTFPDGTVIFENKVVETFVKSIEYIGLDRVSKLQSIRKYGHPLVSTQRNEKGMQVRELDGYFIETHSDTKQKARHIRDIARALRIAIEVELIDT